MDGLLKEIDNEINLAYDMCLKAGYSHEEILEHAKPLLQPVVRDRNRRQMLQMVKSLSKVFITLGLLLLTLYYFANYDDGVTEKISCGLRLVTRAVLMKALLIWDWTPLYEAPCLISNPYFGGSALLKADCAECESFHKIPHIKELTSEKFVHKYLMRYRPAIVQDATESWPIMKETFNIESVLKWYLEDKNAEDICKFNSSISSNNTKEVLDKILSGEASKFIVQWVNCNKGAVRYLRRFYNRPYFSSEAVEFTGNSWVALSTKYKSQFFHVVFENNDLVLFLVQVRGYSDIRLTPKKPCHKMCQNLTETLNEAEILVIPAKMWNLEYSMHEDVDNFLLGLEAFA